MQKVILNLIMFIVAWYSISCFAPRHPFGSWHAPKVMRWHRAQFAWSLPALSPRHGAPTK